MDSRLYKYTKFRHHSYQLKSFRLTLPLIWMFFRSAPLQASSFSV